MPTHKDAEKRVRQTAKRRERNRYYRSTMRTSIKKLLSAIEGNDLASAEAALPATVGVIQRVAQKGIIHKRQAARRVSRLSSAVNRLRQPA